MKIVVFGNSHRVGLLHEGRVLDLDSARRASHADGAVFSSLQTLVDSGDRGLDLTRELIEKYRESEAPTLWTAVSDVQLQAPVTAGRMAMAGGNNADHVANALRNQGRDVSAAEIREQTRRGRAAGFWVVTPPAGPGADVQIPSNANGLFDYEAEVAVVLGRGGKRIDADAWRDHVWGTVLVIDWSIRADKPADTALPFYGHKIFDTSNSLGPWISIDEVDPMDLMVETTVNGETRQKYNNGGAMIHSYGELLSELSQDVTLRPGDMLSGGTGPGTAVDSTDARSPGPLSRKLFLDAGDEVTVSAEGLGSLSAHLITS